MVLFPSLFLLALLLRILACSFTQRITPELLLLITPIALTYHELVVLSIHVLPRQPAAND